MKIMTKVIMQINARKMRPEMYAFDGIIYHVFFLSF